MAVRSAGWAGACLLILGLAACTPESGMGYVEVKVVPVAAAPSLYFDAVKLEPVKNGTAILRQKVGTTKLQAPGSGGQLVLLCEITVKKDRITTVTVSALERPPRCQCQNSGSTSASANRLCLA